jgi:hypothetical protein
MSKKIVGLIVISLAISACSGNKEKSTVVQSMQKKDKNLSCKELLLEMNEADFYRNMAHKNRGLKLKNVLMPLGYVSTYMNSEDAIEAADARVSYLDKIYEIMHCQQKEQKEEEDMESAPVYKPGPTGRNELPIYQSSENLPVYQQPDQLPIYKEEKPIQSTRYEYSGMKFYQPAN